MDAIIIPLTSDSGKTTNTCWPISNFGYVPEGRLPPDGTGVPLETLRVGEHGHIVIAGVSDWYYKFLIGFSNGGI